MATEDPWGPDALPAKVVVKRKRKKHDAEEDHMIHIHVLKEAGEQVLKHAISLHPRKKVEDLFKRVGRLLGVPPLRQRLFYNDKELDPSLRLEEAIVDPDGHHVENCAVTLEMEEDTRYILTGSVDRSAAIWSVETGEKVREFKGHINSINTAVFNKDGSLIATSSDDHNVRIWSTLTGKCMYQLNGHKWAVNSAAFAPDEILMVTASHDATIKVWKMAGELCKLTIPRYPHPPSLIGHGGPCTSAAFNSEMTLILSSSHDRTAALWSAETGERVMTFKGHNDILFTAVFSADESAVLTSSGDRSARLWSSETGACLKIFRGDGVIGHHGCVVSAGFTFDGASVLTICEDKLSGRVFNIETGKCKLFYKKKEDPGIIARSEPGMPCWEAGPKKHGNFTNSAGPFNSAAYSWDSKSIAAASIDRTAKLYDVETGELIRTFRGHGGGVVAVKWMPETIETEEEPPPSEPDDREFHIHLDTTSDANHGLDVEPDLTGTRLLLKGVTGGLAEKWNKNHPFERVEPGDYILSVNGVREEPSLMLRQLKKRQVLEFTFLREVSLDVVFEMVLDTSDYEELGIEFHVAEDGSERLCIDCVFGNLVEKYNQKIANDKFAKEEHQVAKGDFIVEVNKVTADSKLLKAELEANMKALVVKIVREAPKDIYWDAVLDLSSEGEIPLGMEISLSADHKSLTIDSIGTEEGNSVFEAWNSEQLSTMQVCAGDLIIQVNGIRKFGKQMLKAFEQATGNTLSEITTVPPEPSDVPETQEDEQLAPAAGDAKAEAAAAPPAPEEAAEAAATESPEEPAAATADVEEDAAAASDEEQDAEADSEDLDETAVDLVSEGECPKRLKLKIYRQVIFYEDSVHTASEHSVHTPEDESEEELSDEDDQEGAEGEDGDEDKAEEADETLEGDGSDGPDLQAIANRLAK